jgi:hypothetical protein
MNTSPSYPPSTTNASNKAANEVRPSKTPPQTIECLLLIEMGHLHQICQRCNSTLIYLPHEQSLPRRMIPGIGIEMGLLHRDLIGISMMTGGVLLL